MGRGEIDASSRGARRLEDDEVDVESLLEALSAATARAADLERELERRKEEHLKRTRSLAAANVNSAQLISEIEERNQQFERMFVELEKKSGDSELQARALAEANVNSARLVVEIEEAKEELERAHHRLENSFDEVKKEQALREIEMRRMETELRTAKAVQAMLIPKEAPRTIDGFEFAFSYRSASECGGDWLGFFEDPMGESLAVLIGDVSGHGVGPALVTAGAFSYFSVLRSVRLASEQWAKHRSDEQPPALAGEWRGVVGDPALMLENLNAVIGDMGKGEMHMTFFASIIDCRRRKIRFSNAGHCPPYVISRPDGVGSAASRDHPKMLLSRGEPLGCRPEARYASAEVDLHAGGLVLWYTDGIIENRNANGEAIGRRRLGHWAFDVREESAERVKMALEAQVEAFIGPRELEDDIAFIVAKVQ